MQFCAHGKIFFGIFLVVAFFMLTMIKIGEAQADIAFVVPEAQKLESAKKVIIWVSSELKPVSKRINDDDILEILKELKTYGESKLESVEVSTIKESPILVSDEVDASVIVLHLMVTQKYDEHKYMAAIQVVIGQGEGRDDRLGVNNLRILLPNTSYPVIINAQSTVELRKKIIEIGKGAINSTAQIIGE